MYLIVDTETTGLPPSYQISCSNIDEWPRLVQCAWQVHDVMGNLIEFENFIIKPDHYEIPFNAFKIHGITNEIAYQYGVNIDLVLSKLNQCFDTYACIIGHNLEFDLKILESEFFRKKQNVFPLRKKKFLDTKLFSVSYCGLIGKGKRYKWPTLSELYHKLFQENFIQSHNASNDVKATSRCFLELLRIGIISSKDIGIKAHFIYNFQKKYRNTIPKSLVSFVNENEQKKKIIYQKNKNRKINMIKSKRYSHIHNHTHFSILYSTINIKSLISQALHYNMPAVGITDYGNMMGSFYFLNAIHSINTKYYPNKKIKGIVGCEMFISENHVIKKFTKEYPDKRYPQVFLSKNKQGYKNLSKLCSLGFIEGLYSGIPRIDRKLIEKYKDQLIALTGDIHAEIPHTILNEGEKKAEKKFLWWKELFGDNFYIELLRHGLEEEDYVNDILLKFSNRYSVKYIVQNNVFYLNQEEAPAQDILLCIKNGEKQSTPIGKGMGYRFGFPNHEFYFKSVQQMNHLFSDVPEAFDFLDELIEKIECYHISKHMLLPTFQIPTSIRRIIGNETPAYDENDFLKKTTYDGAKKRYKPITKTVKDRIGFELRIIEKIGYPGYFLIVKNIIDQAKKMNISVGPGRGSVAGSVVAYCLGITEIDPIKYNLLFERFLNPDRISLPDIDIDFDDVGREKIIEWVVQQYGKNQVSQIITYATMGAKSSIRDVGRVLGVPLKNIDNITKMIPYSLSLKTLFSNEFPLEKMKKEEKKNIHELRKEIKNPSSLLGEVLRKAKMLEGTIRSTGIHACGIIISPNDITEYVPVAMTKESNLLITQYDNHVVEHMGLLKMDLLGLKTLTIIKDTIKHIQKHTNVQNIKFSLTDQKTYHLFQKGETIGIFQYESTGMRKYLRKLQPDKFEDLIAMNALYRPGPMQYIPNFIDRKHGKELIHYDLPEMEEFLKETYGITIYQEQVMLIAQKISEFSKGDADVLRKAMGKKQKDILFKMKNRFISQSRRKGYKKKIIEKIWRDWEHFSCYAFNKSHATCYSYIAFQTAYLKAHFPCEFMASVLSHNMNNIKQMTFFIEECRRIGISVIAPDINESLSFFRVKSMNCIQFGLAGIKGIGKNAVKIILDERIKNGNFSSIFDFVKRVDLRVVNKKSMESLILSGSLDCFHIEREQYFYIQDGEKLSTLEKIIQFSSKNRKVKTHLEVPVFSRKGIRWNNMEKLSKEKEVLGIYATSHPLDEYVYEIKYLTNSNIKKLNHQEYPINGKKLYVHGILSHIEKKNDHGIQYGIFQLEDSFDSKEFRIYGDTYKKYEPLLYKNNILYLCLSLEKSKQNDSKINIIHIENMKDVLNNLVRKLIIKINVNHLNSVLINHVEEVLCKQVGDKDVEFFLYEEENKTFLNFRSKKYKVRMDDNLFRKLEKIKGLDFYLN
ncbi:DNA polymerase III subunit alpha [Blattabacterium cuenoti]|uniref:DNA polymerase III subunit alpha n=1 Tax=Blattabacterium cuenoti TaxID=1653831 RepID=UPI00163BB043